MYPIIRAWWVRDTALHSFLFVQCLIGLPFFAFGTYSIYQMQIVGYLIGHDVAGQPCTTYCIVPWAGSQLDLNSIILYLNAFIFGLGGVVTLLLAAYSDYWSHKHLLVTIAVVCYGVFAVPAYWLQSHTVHNFYALSALYVVFQVVTLIMMSLMSIYIPHCMRGIRAGPSFDETPVQAVSGQETCDAAASRKRKYGFNMSLLGQVANGVGGTLVYVIVIILTQTLSPSAAQSSGLLVSTITGFIAVAGASVAYYGLPAIPSRPATGLKDSWLRPIIELVVPVKDLLVRKNMAALLISYTIYTDCAFAVNSAISQLFIAEIRPGALEFSLFSLAQSLCLLGCSLAFLWIQPLFRIKLETWLIIGLALLLLIPAWACIGIANVNFGFKSRWEFYVQLFVFQISGAFVNVSFRVLLAEMIPIGTEIRWYSMQLVLSCTTVWVNYVASGPLQNATHQLRFPLILSLIFLALAFVIELCRVTLPMFRKDLAKWRKLDRTGIIDDLGSALDNSASLEKVGNVSEKSPQIFKVRLSATLN